MSMPRYSDPAGMPGCFSDMGLHGRADTVRNIRVPRPGNQVRQPLPFRHKAAYLAAPSPAGPGRQEAQEIRRQWTPAQDPDFLPPLTAVHLCSRRHPPVTGMDSEVARLVSLMGGLVNGNGAKASDMEVLHGSTRAVSVDLLMEVTFGWTSRTRTLAGDIAVHGSRCCRNADEAGRHMAEACRAACLDPGLARRAADMIAPAPLAAYRTYADGYLVGPLQGGGTPRRRVRQVAAAPVTSHASAPLAGSGAWNANPPARRAACSAAATVPTWSMASPAHAAGAMACAATGLASPAAARGTQQCGRCGGHGRTGCMPCGRTGRLTHIHTAHATGRISRTACYAEGTPNSFRTACEALPDIACLAGPDGQLEDTELLPGRGMVGVVLHCRTQHVRADLACRGERISVDAIGPSLAMPLMPPFLDGLTAELAEDIAAAHLRHPAKALELASRTRLTRDILASVGKGARLDPDASRRRWMGAVSRDHLESHRQLPPGRIHGRGPDPCEAHLAGIGPAAGRSPGPGQRIWNARLDAACRGRPGGNALPSPPGAGRWYCAGSVRPALRAAGLVPSPHGRKAETEEPAWRRRPAGTGAGPLASAGLRARHGGRMGVGGPAAACGTLGTALGCTGAQRGPGSASRRRPRRRTYAPCSAGRGSCNPGHPWPPPAGACPPPPVTWQSGITGVHQSLVGRVAGSASQC